MRAHLSMDEIERFSAYLDGQLPPAEKARLEEHLKSDPEWRQAIEELAATRTLLRSAPRYRAPRNFTITPEQARQYARKSLFPALPAFRFSAALAALSMIAVLTIQLIGFGGVRSAQMVAMAPAASAPQAALPAATVAAEKAMTVQEQPEPTLALEWQNSNTPQNGTGNPPALEAAKQPGLIAQPPGGIVTYGDQNSNTGPAFGMGGGGGPTGPIGPLTLPPNAVGSASNSAETAQAPSQERAAAQPDQSNGPILGLPSQGEGGKIISSSGPVSKPSSANPTPQHEIQPPMELPPLRIAQIAVGALALLSIVAAFFLRRRDS